MLICLGTHASALTVEQTDKLVNRWLDTERQATHLETQWQAEKPVLNQRIALLKAERAQLKSILQRDSAQQSDVAERRAELLAEQTRMEEEQVKLEDGLRSLRKRLDYLARLLPPPLQAPWEKEQQILDGSSQVSDQGSTQPSTQLQVAIAQLGLLADFDQRVSVHEMPLTTPNGSDVLVKQIYLGVGAAWFVGGDGTYAGWGAATPEGWVWHFDDSLDGDEIAKAVAVFEKKQQAELVTLPLRLPQIVSIPASEPASKRGSL